MQIATGSLLASQPKILGVTSGAFRAAKAVKAGFATKNGRKVVFGEHAEWGSGDVAEKRRWIAERTTDKMTPTSRIQNDSESRKEYARMR